MNNQICPVCLDELDNNFKITTPCNHNFCFKCFVGLYSFQCPYCRKDFKNALPEKIHTIILENSKKEPKNKTMLNIFNHNDFPPLG